MPNGIISLFSEFSQKLGVFIYINPSILICITYSKCSIDKEFLKYLARIYILTSAYNFDIAYNLSLNFNLFTFFVGISVAKAALFSLVLCPEDVACFRNISMQASNSTVEIKRYPLWKNKIWVIINSIWRISNHNTFLLITNKFCYLGAVICLIRRINPSTVTICPPSIPVHAWDVR